VQLNPGAHVINAFGFAFKTRCDNGVVEVEPPILLVGGVVGERQVDVLQLHVPM
jgi:hypothetical protein